MGKKQQPSPPSETFVDAAQLPAAEILLAGERLVSVVARNVESGRLSEHAISQAWATASKDRPCPPLLAGDRSPGLHRGAQPD